MDMEIDPPKSSEQKVNPGNLFEAAETGDSSAFKSLSQKQLAEALSLRSEDARSLRHVAVSKNHSEVVKVLLTADESKSLINSVDEDGVDTASNLLSFVAIPGFSPPNTARSLRGCGRQGRVHSAWSSFKRNEAPFD